MNGDPRPFYNPSPILGGEDIDLFMRLMGVKSGLDRGEGTGEIDERWRLYTGFREGRFG
jgi:hypothetical protein